MKQFFKSLLIAICFGVAFAPAYADDPCKNLWNENYFIGNGYYSSGRWEDAYNYSAYDVPVKANTDYTMFQVNNHSWGGYITFWDGDKFISSPNIGNESERHMKTPANCNKVTIVVANHSNTIKIQLEEGSTATPYQPYNPLCATCDGIIKTYESATGTVSQNGTPTPTNPIEPTFYTQGDMVLRKVGDVADSYDATTGKITRRIGVRVLNGTEDWTAYPSIPGLYYSEDAITDNNTNGASSLDIMSNQYSATNSGTMDYNNTIRFQQETARPHTPVISNRLYIRNTNYATPAAFKQFLADQYAAGTPVTVYYPLKEASYYTEDWPSSYCHHPIKIATTAYNNNAFSSVQTALNTAVSTIKDVVANTITQTAAIAQIASDKQTRPNSACPAGKTCLLVEDMNGEPHWYEIIEEYIPPEPAEPAPTPVEP